MKSKQSDWIYLGREAFLLLLFAYVILLGGGFSALVDFRLQAISTVLALIVLGGWLVICILGKAKLPASGIDWAILIFLFSQFISVAFSEDPRRSLPHAVLWLIYVFVFYLTLDLIRRGWPQSLLVKSLLIVGGVLLAFSILDLGQLLAQWRNLIAGLEFAPSFQQRLSTIVGDPNLLAAITNLLLPIAMASLLATKNNLARAVLAIYLVASLMIIYFTDSRGGLLGFGASITVFAALWVLVVSEAAKQRVLRWATWLWGRKLFLSGAVALFLAAVGFVAWRFLSFEGSTTHAPVVGARDIYWDAAVDALQADPLTGAGPGMYPVYLMKIWSTPPARPYLHAHSFPFQVAAESGLLGLATLAILIFAVVRRAWQSWRGLEFPARAWWVAALAGLVGLSAHSLVDDFFPFPAVGASAFVLLAMVTWPLPTANKQVQFSPWLLAAPGLAAAVFSFYSLNAYFHADEAVAMGQQGNWAAAAAEMETAATSDPSMASYWLQAGYAHGRAAEVDTAFLDPAIAEYEKGVQMEPEYALSHANLGALYWTSGKKEQGLQEMRIATSLAAESWLLWLNEGIYEEELGLSREALASYSLAINLKPEILDAAFWSATAVRNSATQITVDTYGSDDPRTKASALVEEAKKQLRFSEFDAARLLLEEAYALNDQEVNLYVALAELSLADGEVNLAERYVQSALWIQATSNQAKVEAILLGAEISLAKGDRQEALERFQIAYDAIFAETSYGWGSYGWSPYSWFVFQRIAFPEDLLPQLERADITKEIAGRLLTLVDLYEEAGETEKAQDVKDVLTNYLP